MRVLLYASIACALLSAPLQAAESISSKLDSLFGTLGRAAPAEEEFLDPDEAFRLAPPEIAAGKILFNWEIEKNYYLYRDNFRFSIQAPEAVLGEPVLPAGELKEDPAFGNVYVVHDAAEISLPYSTSVAEVRTELTVTYQGCKEDTICYPPVSKKFDLLLPASDKLSVTQMGAGVTSVDLARSPAVISSQDRISRSLQEEGFWASIVAFLGFGLLLAFTPCILPMIPILSGIIVGHGHSITTRHAFMLSLVYVLATSFTYAALGIIAALLQINLQAAAQETWVIVTFSLVFVLLSFSMFGFYELQLPVVLQGHLLAISHRQRGGTLIGAGVMGILSAVIVGPCVAPPLAGALIFISQTGDAVLGGLALFALGFGMGLPLLIIGASGGKYLPRAGLWMEKIKYGFGVIMLGVAIWLLSRILPASLTLFLWGVLLMVAAIYMGALDRLTASPRWAALGKGVGLVLLVYGVMLIIGAGSGGQDVFRPLSGFGTQITMEKPDFKLIKSKADLERALTEADWKNRPVLLDFYADWCITCKEMEKYTFAKPEVQAALKDMILLKADVTLNDETDQELLQEFGIFGPPAILFFVRGVEQRPYRLVGFVNAEDFIRHLQQVYAL